MNLSPLAIALLLVAGLVLLLLARMVVRLLLQLTHLERTGARTQGTVVRVVELRSPNYRRGLYFHPVINFTAADGHSYQFTSDVGIRPNHWHVGQQVTVRYQPDNPRQAEMRSFFTWAAPLMITLFCLIGSAIMIISFFVRGQPNIGLFIFGLCWSLFMLMFGSAILRSGAAEGSTMPATRIRKQRGERLKDQPKDEPASYAKDEPKADHAKDEPKAEMLKRE